MNILVSTSSFGKFDASPLQLLDRAGYTAVINPHGRTLKPVEVLELAAGCPGIVAGTEGFSDDVLRQLTGLKVISRVGTGLDSIDLEAAEILGITVCNTPDAPAQAVAELTIGLALSLLRGISEGDSLVKQGIWRKNMGRLLGGKRVGVVGLGKVGRRVAPLFQAFGCDVSGYDICHDADWAAESQIALVDFDTLLRSSDIVSVHASCGPDAGHLIGETELAKMGYGSMLINTARGRLIDEAALLEGLQSGHIGGAALDVFQEEPYSGRLKEMSNVVLTPHIGSYAREARVDMETQAVENLIAALDVAGAEE